MPATGVLAVIGPAQQATRPNLKRDMNGAVPLARSNQELQRALQDVGSTCDHWCSASPFRQAE